LRDVGHTRETSYRLHAMKQVVGAALVPLLVSVCAAASIMVGLAFPDDAVGTFLGRNGHIAFDQNGSIYTAKPNGRELALIAARPRSRLNAFYAAEWSPDGNALALVNNEIRRNGASSLLVTDAQGRNPRRVE
jgi:hypothetical protein